MTVTPLEGEKRFQITIPAFKFIGHDKAEFKTVVEQSGVLSWATPEIDTAKAITKILNSEAQQKHVNDNRDLLEAQARSFYSGIIRGVDPTIELTFVFADSE